MAEIGRFALVLAFFLSAYAVLVDPLGNWRKVDAVMTSARNATVASLGCLTIATVVLLILLVSDDFSVKYVAAHSSRDLPLVYKISATWAGAAGSLLLWLWLQVGFVVIAFCLFEGGERRFTSIARSACNLVCAFFLLVLILDKNPFDLSVVAALDGAGLNPLLQHPAMALHPPALFLGYAAFAIPFGWAFASLAVGGTQEIPPLFTRVCNWTLLAWLFLTVGIVLGAWWAYEELGWGGYWSWDPVESASLLPFLTGTALLHCCMAYKPRTTVAKWMTSLCLVTFSLCIFATFLTRYGLVSSLHAFTEPGLGILFLVLLLLIGVVAGILLWCSYRREKKNANLAVEASWKVISLNNWVLVSIVLVIFVGILFPAFSGIFGGQKVTLKPEFFTKITAPGGLALLVLLGVCPNLLRRGLGKNWRTIGMFGTVLAALVIWWFTGKLAPACFIICGFACLNLVADFVGRFVRSAGRENKASLQRPTLRWYGARLIHMGVVLVFIGIAGSGGYGIEKQAALRPGERMSISDFDIVYGGLRADHAPNFTAVTADISVQKRGKFVAELSPSLAFYRKSGSRTSEVDIRRTLANDLYVAIVDLDRSSQLINVNVFVKPLVNLIWIGSAVSIVGVLLVLIYLFRQKSIAFQD